MKLYRLTTLVLLVCAFFNGCSTPKQTVAKKENGKEVIFFDDFTGTALDRTKWNVRVTGGTVNNEQQAYVDSSLTISIVHGAQAEGAENGALQLQPHFSPGWTTKEGKKFDFISGRIDSRSKVEFMYGRASARIKLTEGRVRNRYLF